MTLRSPRRRARRRTPGRNDLWAARDRDWRDPSEVASQWREASQVNPRLLKYRTYGAWWETLAEHDLTLLLTREYEHLIVAMTATAKGGEASFMPLPHPSGLVVDRAHGRVHVASTRNPNQVYELAAVAASMPRLDARAVPLDRRPLIPVVSRFYPGCFYLHDLALIGGVLHANSVGQNAIVSLGGGAPRVVWWPECIDGAGRREFGVNHIQLNSIAAGATVEESYFTASGDAVLPRRPGDPRYPVDGRGVVFSGRTRRPVTTGLTRPHSARWHDGSLWIANSGYGELCRCDLPGSSYTVVAKAPGWTRGLCLHDGVAFVGTSRVIPRFSRYAPGLDLERSVCGVHAISLATGKALGGVTWPDGNQIFAIDWIDRPATAGFPFTAPGRAAARRQNALFYAGSVEHAAAMERS